MAVTFQNNYPLGKMCNFWKVLNVGNDMSFVEKRLKFCISGVLLFDSPTTITFPEFVISFVVKGSLLLNQIKLWKWLSRGTVNGR